MSHSAFILRSELPELRGTRRGAGIRTINQGRQSGRTIVKNRWPCQHRGEPGRLYLGCLPSIVHFCFNTQGAQTPSWLRLFSSVVHQYETFFLQGNSSVEVAVSGSQLLSPRRSHRLPSWLLEMQLWGLNSRLSS